MSNFPDRETFGLAGRAILLIVVLKTEPHEVIDCVIRAVSVQVCDLPFCWLIFAQKKIAHAAPAAALRQNLRFVFDWNSFAGCHQFPFLGLTKEALPYSMPNAETGPPSARVPCDSKLD